MGNQERQVQRDKLTVLINDTEQAQQKTLELMIKLRKEIASLSDLKKHYPESTRIKDRIEKCDEILDESSKVIVDMKTKLAEFKKQKETLDELLNQANEPETSESNGFKCNASR